VQVKVEIKLTMVYFIKFSITLSVLSAETLLYSDEQNTLKTELFCLFSSSFTQLVNVFPALKPRSGEILQYLNNFSQLKLIHELGHFGEILIPGLV